MAMPTLVPMTTCWPVDLVGLAHRLDDARASDAGIGRLGDGDLQDGELVAAHARDGVGLAHEHAQPLGDHLQQLVAGGMAERVVDGLEVVEVEQVRGDDLAALDAGKRLLQPLVEQHAVGQAGQRIVMRHVRDLGLGAALLGDVLMRRDRAAVGHRLHRDGDAAAVAELAVELAEAASVAPAQHAARRSHRPTLSDFRPLAMRCSMICFSVVPGLHLLRSEPVDFGVAAVAQHQAVLGVEHRQALDDVVERRIELHGSASAAAPP